MKALIYHNFQGPLTIQQVADPIANQDGAIIRVKATGLCRSDWHGWMGHDPDIELPHVPGHELSGEIEFLGKNVKNFNIGDRVTVPFVCGCGHCEQCISGNHQVCDYQSQPGFTHWGSFAEYVAIDYADTNLVRLPDDMHFTTAATLGCRFVTSYRAVVEQGQIKEGQYLAVHGCGGIGLSAIMIANALGAKPIAIDINEDALSFAKEIGAAFTINALNENDIVEKVREITSGGAQLSIDALGSATTCLNSIANLRKRGKHIQVGLMTGNDLNLKIAMDKVLANELEIIGSHGMQAYKYPEMLQLIQKGKLQPQKLIENTISLEDAAAALAAMNRFESKGILVINKF